MDIKNKEAFESQFKLNAIYERESRIRKNNILEFAETAGIYFNIVTNNAWKLWQAAQAQAGPEGFVLVRKEDFKATFKSSVSLTCADLLEAFQYGAPDGEGDKDQMTTEMTIEWVEDGHSGKGYYAYYSEYPEEGSIKLGEVIEAPEQSHEHS